VGWVTEERRRMPMTVFVSVSEVRRALGCSRSARTSISGVPPAARRVSAACLEFR
jgi:hypothetical protein